MALAYDFFSAANQNNQLTVIGSFNQSNNNRAGFGFAGEYTLKNLGGSGFGAALRGSYSWAPANNDDVAGTTVPTALSDEENLQGLAGGGGLFYQTSSFLLGADYAYKYMGVLGPTHFISFSLGW